MNIGHAAIGRSAYSMHCGFQGLYHDDETQLIYNRARMLSPRLERFIQRDPLGYPDGMNTYAAYHVMHGGVDPMGMRKSEVYVECRRLGKNGRGESTAGDIVGHLGYVHCSVITKCGDEEFTRYELGVNPEGPIDDDPPAGEDVSYARYELERLNDYPDEGECDECRWHQCIVEMAPKLFANAPKYDKFGTNSNTYVHVLITRCGFRLKPRLVRKARTLWIDNDPGDDYQIGWDHVYWSTEPYGAIGWKKTKPWKGRGGTHPAGEKNPQYEKENLRLDVGPGKGWKENEWDSRDGGFEPGEDLGE